MGFIYGTWRNHWFDIYTAFIHIEISINITLHLITVQHMLRQPFISRNSLCPMKSLFLLISSTFSFYCFVKNLKYNRSELGWCGFDVASWRVEIRMDGTVSGDRVVRWPTLTLKSTWPSIFGIWPWPSDRVNCPAISPLWDSRAGLTLRCPNMEVLEGVSSTNILQLSKKSQNPWTHHGNIHNPSPWYSVAGEYCSYVLEYFSGQNMTI